MKTAAIVLGVLMLIAGIAGFVPQLCPNGMLFGIFAVNGIHNVIHIATGLAAIAMGMAGPLQARRFFQIFGVVYALVAVLGFFHGGDQPLLGFIAHNTADTWLHVGIAAFSLFMGFAGRDMPVTRAPA
jgi:hypothetical protein